MLSISRTHSPYRRAKELKELGDGGVKTINANVKSNAPGEDRTHDLQMSLFSDYETYCATEARMGHVIKSQSQLVQNEYYGTSTSKPKNIVEMWGIEPQTFHMQSERSTTELHPHYEQLEKTLRSHVCSRLYYKPF